MSELPIESAAPGPRTKSAKKSGGGPKTADKDAARKHAHLKIQIDFPGGARLGPGKVALLEAIDREGSLSRAADAMGISYRRAWLFMSQINHAFDEVAVATPEHGHGGGPARLTEFGKEIVRHYRSLEKEAGRVSQQIVSWLDRHRNERGPAGE